jgi:thiosulfate/3-mercaptopyruvate sulfurtransferase
MTRTRSPRGPLVSARWLREHLDDPALRVVDLRWYLAGKKGADEYAQGHIPGAVFVDLEHAITGPVGPGRHPLPSPAQFERAMRAAGVSPSSRVVVYDDAGGSIAARLWWLLTHHGHAAVHVLDGGITAWKSAGEHLDTAASEVPAGTFTARHRRALPVVDRHAVEAARHRRNHLILDARAAERFRGEVEPVDARAGHIPGARNAPWMENLRDGLFLDARSLRARYRELGVDADVTVICSCGSSVTACHTVLALAVSGLEPKRVRLYEGSWSDWARDPDRPLATGDQ